MLIMIYIEKAKYWFWREIWKASWKEKETKFEESINVINVKKTYKK